MSMPTAEEELKKCAKELRLLEKKMEKNGFTPKQVNLLHDYVRSALELALWAQQVAALNALKS